MDLPAIGRFTALEKRIRASLLRDSHCASERDETGTLIVLVNEESSGSTTGLASSRRSASKGIGAASVVFFLFGGLIQYPLPIKDSNRKNHVEKK